MISWIVNHPKTVLVLMLFPVLAMGHRGLFIKLDNSPETFFAADREARRDYRAMVRTFGSDELIHIQLKGASYREREHVRALALLTRDLRSMDAVSGVISLTRVLETGNGNAPENITGSTMAMVQREADGVPLYRKLGLVRDDPPALGCAAIIVMENAESRLAFISDLKNILKNYDTPEVTTSYAGLTPTNAAFDLETRRALFIFMPGVILVSLVIGLALFRSVRALPALFLPVFGSVALGVAALEIANSTLNLVTAVMPPLVLAIGFAGAIHMVTHYASVSRETGDLGEAARRTIREKFTPTAFAFVTTAIGFGSLGLSSVTSVRTLGLASAGTLVITLVLVTAGTPAFLLWLRPALHSPAHRQNILVDAALFSIRRRVLVFAAALVFVTAAVAGMVRVTQSINGLKLLPKKAPERTSYEELEAAGIGLGNLDLWIKKKTPDLRTLISEYPDMKRLSGSLEEVPLITAVITPADLLDRALSRYPGARTALVSNPGLINLAPGHMRKRLMEELRFYWNPGQGFKVTALSLTTENQEIMTAQKEGLLEAARGLFPKSETILSGHYAMLISTPGALMDTLKKSLALTSGVIAVLFLLFFRSLSLALGGMTANLLPVLAILGIMGWTGIPVDVATVMTASVAFGLAVDDTFHYLYHRKKSGSITTAASIAGQGITATTMVVAGGFAVLGLAGFLPVMRFGLLTSAAALSALAIDVFLLPALVGRKGGA